MSHASCPTLERCREIAALLEKTQAELDRRTAWANEQITTWTTALAESQSDVSELEFRIRELEAELRKYEPSDGVMMQRLGDLQAIKEATRIFDLLVLGKSGFEQLTLHDLLSWLALPAVAQARKMP